MDEHVKTAIWAVADDWRARHESGGDCTEFPTEIMEILLPEIGRAGIERDEAMHLVIAAGNYADGSDPDVFRKLLISS